MCIYLTVRVCVCKAPLIAGLGVRKGCSHLIFPLWSLNMYKPEVGYVSVPTPHTHVCVYNCKCVCMCVCNISTKNSRPVLFYQHLGIVARTYPTPARAPPPAAADAAYEMRFEAATEPGFVWSDEKMTVNGRLGGEGKRKEGGGGKGAEFRG